MEEKLTKFPKLRKFYPFGLRTFHPYPFAPACRQAGLTIRYLFI